MGKKPEEPPKKPQPKGGDRDKVPPFDPDPRLAAYLEGGRKSDAERRFRRLIKEREKGR